MKWADRKIGQQRGRRRGDVFGVRMTDQEKDELLHMREQTAGPEGLGPWLLWAALRAFSIDGVLPARAGSTVPARYYQSSGTTDAGKGSTPTAKLKILDLCSGSGAWSKPYKDAGYEVIEVTLPKADVRNYFPVGRVHGVLAAPPCDQFSLARNGHKKPRDLFRGLELVSACLRVIALAQPKWWALENPVGLLGEWLGTPTDVWEPYEFGDPWTKRTSLWGRFSIPKRGPFVKPNGSAAKRSTAAKRAITPSGFARAFFEANP